MNIWLFSLLALVTAVLAIRGEYLPTRHQVYTYKPATTLLLILVALNGHGDVSPAYKWLILIGLFFCLGGDIFLMLPPRYFLFGLISFLIGHLSYIAAFVTDAGFTVSVWGLPLLLYGVGIYWLLQPHLGKMRLPVLFYVVTILVMAWQAVGRWTAVPTTPALFAAIGALFFVVSDSILALDRFRQKFWAARILVLSTYWLAQWLIAHSVS